MDKGMEVGKKLFRKDTAGLSGVYPKRHITKNFDDSELEGVPLEYVVQGYKRARKGRKTADKANIIAEEKRERQREKDEAKAKTKKAKEEAQKKLEIQQKKEELERRAMEPDPQDELENFYPDEPDFEFDLDEAEKLGEEQRARAERLEARDKFISKRLKGRDFDDPQINRVAQALAGDASNLGSKDEAKAKYVLSTYLDNASRPDIREHVPNPLLDSILESYGAPLNREGHVDMDFLMGVNGLQITEQPAEPSQNFYGAEAGQRIKSLANNIYDSRVDASKVEASIGVPTQIGESSNLDYSFYDEEGQRTARRRGMTPQHPQLVSGFVGGQRTLGDISQVAATDRKRGVFSDIQQIGGQAAQGTVQVGGVPNVPIRRVSREPLQVDVLHSSLRGVPEPSGAVYNYLTPGLGGALLGGGQGLGGQRLGANITAGFTEEQKKGITLEGALQNLGLGGPQYSGGQAVVGVPQSSGQPPGLNLRQVQRTVERTDYKKGKPRISYESKGPVRAASFQGLRQKEEIPIKELPQGVRGLEERRRNLALPVGKQTGLNLESFRKGTLRFADQQQYKREPRIIQDAGGGYHLISQDLLLTVQERVG